MANIRQIASSPMCIHSCIIISYTSDGVGGAGESVWKEKVRYTKEDTVSLKTSLV